MIGTNKTPSDILLPWIQSRSLSSHVKYQYVDR